MNLAIISNTDGFRSESGDINGHRSLIKINGEYIIERIIRIAKQSGLKKAACIINENEIELKQFLQSNNFGIHLNLIIKNTLSSMQSLISLAPFLSGEAFCLTTSNLFFDESEFTEFINYSSLQKEIEGTLAVTRSINEENPFCVAMAEDDTILKFSDSKDGYSWAAGGIYFFNPKIFEEMISAAGSGVSKLKDILRVLIAHKNILKGFSFSKIIDVDQISDREYFLNLF